METINNMNIENINNEMNNLLSTDNIIFMKKLKINDNLFTYKQNTYVNNNIVLLEKNIKMIFIFFDTFNNINNIKHTKNNTVYLHCFNKISDNINNFNIYKYDNKINIYILCLLTFINNLKIITNDIIVRQICNNFNTDKV